MLKPHEFHREAIRKGVDFTTEYTENTEDSQERRASYAAHPGDIEMSLRSAG
jgi:hypothetical protein